MIVLGDKLSAELYGVIFFTLLIGSAIGTWVYCRHTGFCYYRVEWATLPELDKDEQGRTPYLLRRFSAQDDDIVVAEFVQWETPERITEQRKGLRLIDGATSVMLEEPARLPDKIKHILLADDITINPYPA